MKKPRSIVIIGRRWFRRGAGNTYCTATIIIDGEFVYKTSEQSGYADHYADIACQWLEKNGHITQRERHSNGGKAAHWRHIRDDNGIAYHYEAADVACEKDL